MTARSGLTQSSGSTVTTAEYNDVVAHLVTRTGSNDVAAEGQLCANTSTGRIVAHNGSAARDILAYKTAGAIGYEAAQIALVGGLYFPTSGGTSQLQWNTSGTGVNLDSHGFDGAGPSKSVLTIPSDLTGWFSFHADLAWSTSWSFGTADWLQLNVSGRPAQLAVQSGIGGTFSASWGPMRLTAGTTLELYMRQTSGSTQNLTGAGRVELCWHGW